MIPAHGDSSTGSELKAVEEAVRLLERSNHANSVPLRCNNDCRFGYGVTALGPSWSALLFAR
jgi:hypothetical protein